MNSNKPSYPEALLHWIWENRHWEFGDLQTSSGKKIRIHDPGSLNKSDGPDFSGAALTIGALRWHGDVEIHWSASDWRAHGHHDDANFNNVILHVVFEKTDRNSTRQDQTSIPTLCLSQFLSEPLQSFLDRYRSEPELPCAGQLSFISEEAFAKQLEKAHKEYFEQKVDDLLEFYDPSLPPSDAWIKMFAIALFDGLGISHNRTPMQKLAAGLIDGIDECSSRDELREWAYNLSGFNKRHPSPLDPTWKHKGCRPGNHPRPRIKQGADALWHIYSLPFDRWIRDGPDTLWQDLLDSISADPGLGRERSAILFGTVFLPALYSLGNLFFVQKLKNRSWELWRNHRAPIPSSLLKKLDHADISRSIYAQKLGAIYQLRSYCRPRNCQDCEVFKSAISP